MADQVDPRTGELTTANYGWIKPTVGASTDAWGGYINSDLDGIDSTVHSIQTSVPAASSTTPAMDGTAAVGTGTTYARADHVHPSDTTKYNATNPSGYQTAAQVTASLGSYLALSGGTMTGAMTLAADPAANLQPATKQYADKMLPLAGGTLTGPITPAAGIVGTTTNNNAAAGQVGEYILGSVGGGPVSSGALNNGATLSLTAGDWDVTGRCIFTPSGNPTINMIEVGLSTVSATLQTTGDSGGYTLIQAAFATGGQHQINTGMARYSLAAPTTIYVVAGCNFSGGTGVSISGLIWARRAR